MAEKKKEKDKDKPKASSAGGGSGLDNVIAKIDEVVGKAVPEKFQRSAVAGGAVLTLLFFLLWLIGLFSSPGGVADDATEAYNQKEQELIETQGKLEEAQEASKQAEKQVQNIQSELQKLESQKQGYENQIEKLKGQIEQERAAKDEVRKDLQEANAQKRDAESKAKALQSLHDRAKRETESMKKQKVAAEARYADLNTRYNDLQKQKDLRSKLEGRAREAYENIIKTVSAIEDPAKKLETLRKLARASATELAGTPFQARVDEQIILTQRAMDAQKDRQRKLRRANAKKTTDDALRNARMAPTHEAAMKILAEAKEDVSGTPYEENIHRDMEKREAQHKIDVAREAYEALVKAARDNPLKFDENIALAEKNMESTKGTKFEKLLKRQLDSLTEQRLQVIGRRLYDDSRAQISKSPTDYAANVAALKDYHARAKGTPYERKIAGLLARQEKLLERSQRK